MLGAERHIAPGAWLVVIKRSPILRGDPEHDAGDGVIAELDAREQDGALAGTARISLETRLGGRQRQVVGDVGHVPAARAMPGAVALDREAGTTVVRPIRVAVEVDH